MVRYIKDLHYCMNAERSNAAPTEQDMGLKVTLQCVMSTIVKEDVLK